LLPDGLLSLVFSAPLASGGAATTATTRLPPTAPTPARALADSHVVFLAVLEEMLANGRADFGTSRADAEKTRSRVVKNLYLDAVARDAQLVQCDLDGFIDRHTLRFDTGRHWMIS